MPPSQQSTRPLSPLSTYLHGEIGLNPPAEFETTHRARIRHEHYPATAVPTGAGSK